MSSHPEIAAAKRAVHSVAALPDSQRIGLSIATASRLVILGLTPGQQIWARVRSKRGKRFGPWSESGTWIVNV